MHPPENGWITKQMVPSESAPQELSNEWSCEYVSTILNILGNFCVPPLVEVTTPNLWNSTQHLALEAEIDLFRLT
jgi:hypothetical protein